MVARNKSLNDAKKARNDEFYTKYEDVKKELEHWRHKLKGKRIICPCDGPDSAFVRFLSDVKDEWGIESVNWSCLPVSMFDVEYSKYDICITNPPFSLYKEWLPFIIGRIDFIMLAPWRITLCGYSNSAYIDHKWFLGYGRNLPLKFTNTEKAVNCSWISSFDDYNITRREYEAADWTECTLTCFDYISSYDYDIELCWKAKSMPKKKNFRVYIKKKPYNIAESLEKVRGPELYRYAKLSERAK